MNASTRPSIATCLTRGRSPGAGAISSPDASGREREADEPAEPGEQQAFDEQLPRRSAGASRRARGAPPPRADVRRRARAACARRWRRRSAGRIPPRRASRSAPSRVLPTTRSFSEITVTWRLEPGNSCSRRAVIAGDVRLRAFDRHVGLQPREHAQAVAAARGAAFGQRQRRPHLGADRPERREREVARHDSDHRVALAVEAVRLPMAARSPANARCHSP